MPADTIANQICQGIDRLLADRATHVGAISRIDGTLSAVMSLVTGSNGAEAKESAPTKTLKAPAPSSGKKRRGPGTYAVTAVETILAFIKAHADATTAEVNAHWKEAGRNGKPDNTITLLVKEKKLKCRPIERGRGSTYSLA